MADKTEFLQAIDDAILDADSLEKFINGSDSETVLTRLNAEYPTIKNMLAKIKGDATADYEVLFDQLMQENNIAGRFRTVLELQASSLDDGSYALVADDAEGANGVYIKEDGLWVRSSYDPSKKAEDYIEGYLEINKDPENKNLVDFVDGVGSVFASFDADSGLILSDMSEDNKGLSVQRALDNVPKKAPTHSEDIIKFEDANGNTVAKIDGAGHLHIPLLDKSLQHSLESILPTINQKRRLEKEFFTDAVAKYSSHLSTLGNPIAPMPLGLLPSNYTVPDTIIDELTEEGEHTALDLDSPYLKNDQFVHPCIIECMGSFRGYRYLLLINPFSVEYWENPVVYGSNNLIDFDLMDGFYQPLAHAEHDNTDYRAFLSDSVWTYDPVSGELLALWRSSYHKTTAGTETEYWLSRTTDLLHWTPAEMYIPPSAKLTDNRRSPSVLFNPEDGLWYMFSSNSPDKFVVRTAKQLNGEWSSPTNIPMPSGIVTWHQEVKYVGNKFVSLFNDRDAGRYYLGISSDGYTWNVSTHSIFNERIPGLYKASFIPELTPDGGGIFFHIFYTWYSSNRPFKLMHVKTNTISL